MIHHANAHGLIAIDWIVIALYVTVILALGWYYSRQQTSGGEFLVAKERPMRPTIVGISFFATLMSTISYLGKPGEIINKGPMAALAQILVVPVVYVIVAYVVLPTIMRQRVTSVYEYLEARIGVIGRLAGAVLFIFLRLVWMGLMTYLTSVVLAVVMGLDPRWVPFLSIAVGSVAIAYSSMGGFRAVVVTDTLQATLLFLGAIATIVVVTWHSRGVDWIPTTWLPTWDTQPIFSFDPHVRITLVGSFLHMLLWGVATSCGDQTAVQRFMAVRDLPAARRLFLVNSGAVVVTIVLLGFVGFALHGFFTRFAEALPPDMTIDRDADKLFPYFIAHYLPAGLSGLLVTAFIAAAMSSLDSGVNAITAVISRDFLERFNRLPASEAAKVRSMRWITLGIGLTVIALGLLVKHVPGNVYAVTNKTANLVSVPIFGMLVMAWYMPFVTPLGALIGTLCSVTVAGLVGFWDVLTGREAVSFQYIGLSSMVVGLSVGGLLSRYGPRREDYRGTRNWAIGSLLVVAIATTVFLGHARG